MPADVQNALLEIGQSVVEMKVLMKPIEMIARFSEDGILCPVKFMVDQTTIRVEHVIFQTEEKLAGNRMRVFRCQSELHG